MPEPLASPANDSPADDAVLGALQSLLAPLARLVVARGVPWAVLEELLKQAVVRAADEAHPGLLPHRKVSRVSTATGINRREVTRLIQVLREGRAGEPPPRRSLASEVFTHWQTDPTFRDAQGQPLTLPRHPPADGGVSFEALAQAVTRDVHPRSLLDELVRLGLAQWDEAADTVALSRDAFVPRGDTARMLQFLGANVGDHFAAAVDNVLGDDRRHFEQAIFADGLTAASIEAARSAVAARWKALLAEVVPELEALVARDDGAEGATHRLRLGLYTFNTDTAAPAGDASGDDKPPQGGPT